jgi:hypothetical protein
MRRSPAPRRTAAAQAFAGGSSPAGVGGFAFDLAVRLRRGRPITAVARVANF